MHPPRHLRMLPVLLLGLLVLSAAACQPLMTAGPSEDQLLLHPEAAVPPLPTAVPAAPVPVRLAIPALQLDVPVAPMGWAVGSDPAAGTEWVLPTETAGWHANSALAGAPGNTIISGSQVTGAAVFAPLALDEAAVGQVVILTDSAGVTFTYTITEIPDPLPIRGGTAAQDGAARAYMAPTAPDAPARLTLITGWPDFTTTHRQFVIAALAASEAQP